MTSKDIEDAVLLDMFMAKVREHVVNGAARRLYPPRVADKVLDLLEEYNRDSHKEMAS